MKIFAIAHEDNFNGASISLLDILIKLSSEHEITLFIPFKSSIIENKANKYDMKIICEKYTKWMIYKGSGRYIFKRKILWKFKEKKSNRIIINKLSEKLLEEKYDLIYTNTRVIDLGANLSINTKIPHIWHFREFGEEDFGLIPIESYKKHYNTIDKGTNLVITNSKAVENKFKKLISCNIPIQTIYNGVDELHIHKKIFKKEYKNVNFIITGRISETKGHRLIVKAIKILLDKGINKFRVYAVGKGDLKSVCSNDYCKTIASYFIPLGQIDNIEEVRKKMDIELMCSKSEAFGRVTVEAMLSSMPVIGSKSGGTVELIRDGENGLLYESENEVELAEKMELFINNVELIEKMGNNAYLIAINKYTRNICCNNIQSCMENFIKESKILN